MIRKVVTYCLILVLNVALASAKEKVGFSDYVDSTKITFYFNVGTAAIDLNYGSNNAMLDKLRKLAEKQSADSVYVPRVDVFAGVSPEGSDEANANIRWKRLENSINLISRYFQLPQYKENYFDAKVTVPQIWQNLSVLVKKSNIPNKERVVQCIQSGGNVPAKLAAIDRDQSTWKKVSDTYFPELRRCEVVIFFKKKEPQKQFPSDVPLLPETPAKAQGKKEETKEEADDKNAVKEEPKDVVEAQKEQKETAVPEKPVVKPKKKTKTIYKPMFAINTNALYDLVGSPNFGIEVPTGKKLSFNASYVFPWWSAKDDTWCYQLQYWELAGKRWLGDRDGKDVMTGHAVGLFAGLGYYDFERKSKGYQGEICVNAGVTYHYAKAFGRDDRWRIQFGAGIGMMRTNYSYYEHKFDHLVWQHDGRYTWIGPTKLEINIGYLIHRKVEVPVKQKGGDDATENQEAVDESSEK